MKKITVQLQFGSKLYILLQSTCTTTYQATTRVKQRILSHKQATCPGKNFEEIIFMVEVKSTKTMKFIVLENFPLYGSMTTACHLCKGNNNVNIVSVYVCVWLQIYYSY